MRKLKKCSICGKDRFDIDDRGNISPDWKTDIIIVDSRYKNLTMKKMITVCPKCRKKPLQKILVDTWFGGKDDYNK